MVLAFWAYTLDIFKLRSILYPVEFIKLSEIGSHVLYPSNVIYIAPASPTAIALISSWTYTLLNVTVGIGICIQLVPFTVYDIKLVPTATT